MRPRVVPAAALVLLALQAAGCEPAVSAFPGGDPAFGAMLMSAHGCGTCHTVPGVSGADGTLGPPLTGYARRVYIAGRLPNGPDNLIRWIRDPQGVEPGTAMPNLPVSAAEARDMAAYLSTLR